MSKLQHRQSFNILKRLTDSQLCEYADSLDVSQDKDYSSFARLASSDMAKSVSIPIALSELKRASLQRLSTRRCKKKDKPLNGFVIFVQEQGEHVKLFGSVNGLEGYEIGDEIIAVNDVEVDGKSRDDILMHIKESIENRTIQLKVKRKTSDSGDGEEPSQPPTVTDAYVVCVDKDDVKKICNQLKQRFADIRTFDMEEIACNRLSNVTSAASNSRENHLNSFARSRSVRGSPKQEELEKKQKEDDFLRNSLRTSKKLRALASNQKTLPPECTIGYINDCYEQQKDGSAGGILERITDHLAHMEGREEDRQMLMNFFQSPSVQDAIQQTAEQHESVANHHNSSAAPSAGSSSTDNGDQRVVTLFKHEDAYLGATVRNEEDRIVIGRIVKGGLVEKMGLLHEGDELIELNGTDLRGKRVDEVCRMLRQINGEVRFIVIPSKEQVKNDMVKSIIHLRALFDYDPEDDVYVPCKELGLKFDRGDVLHVLNTSDENWWQAYREGVDIRHQLAGLIPSSSFHQQVIMCTGEMQRELKAKDKKHHKEVIPDVIRSLGRRGGAEIMRSADEPPPVSYQSQMLTYEEVQMHLVRSDHPRPLVLCGPEGVGCLQLRQRLLQSDSDRLASPVPYTSRPQKDGEIDGVHYHFISKQHFQELAKAGKFIEYGEYQKHWYGTMMEDIVSVIRKRLTCVLSLKPESLAGIRTPEAMPYIVFISPPALHQLRRQKECSGQLNIKDDQLKAIINKGKQIEHRFGHLFDAIIINTDLERSHDELKRILKRIETLPQWVPIEWIPPKLNGGLYQ